MSLFTHKGYRIQTMQTASWYAIVWPPGSSLPARPFLKATLEEGEEAVHARARSLVEFWIGTTACLHPAADFSGSAGDISTGIADKAGISEGVVA